jgi:hypothetical protein
VYAQGNQVMQMLLTLFYEARGNQSVLRLMLQ